jgi:hypothetical protein
VRFPCGIDDFDNGGRDDGNGNDENDKAVKMAETAETVREVADNGNGR